MIAAEPRRLLSGTQKKNRANNYTALLKTISGVGSLRTHNIFPESY